MGPPGIPLRIGADVVVRTLGNARGEVIATERDGRYRVRVGAVTIWCRQDDLATLPQGKPKRAARKGEFPVTAPPDDEPPAGRVDLHGLRVEEGLARVVDEIDRALRRGADRVEVIHGKGSGRMQHALHRHLAAMPVVAAFKLDARNPGVTWVYF